MINGKKVYKQKGSGADRLNVTLYPVSKGRNYLEVREEDSEAGTYYKNHGLYLFKNNELKLSCDFYFPKVLNIYEGIAAPNASVDSFSEKKNKTNVLFCSRRNWEYGMGNDI